MKKLIITSLCALSAPALHGVTILSLTGDVTNTTASLGSSSVVNTLNDTFAYDPLDPTSATPNLIFSNGVAFHAAGAPVTVAYDLNHTIVAGEINFVFDVWGRDGVTNAFSRDDAFTVSIFDGTTLLDTQNGSIGNVTFHDRIDFGNLAPGTVIDGIEINSTVGNVAFQEVRAAVIPEPSAALLGCLGLLGLLRRRR